MSYYIKLEFSVSLWLNIGVLQLFFKCVFLQELNKVTVQLDQVTAKLQEKQEHCSQLESHLKEYREKNLSLEQKAEALEGQIRVCIRQLNLLYFLLSNYGIWWPSQSQRLKWQRKVKWYKTSTVTLSVTLEFHLYFPFLHWWVTLINSN